LAEILQKDLPAVVAEAVREELRRYQEALQWMEQRQRERQARLTMYRARNQTADRPEPVGDIALDQSLGDPVRLEAIALLEQKGGPSARSILQTLAKQRGTSWPVRLAALAALISVDAAAGEQSYRQMKADLQGEAGGTAALRQAVLEAPNPAALGLGCRLLADLQDATAIPFFRDVAVSVQHYGTAADGRRAAHAMAALRALQDRGAVDFFADRVHSEDPVERYASVFALGELQNPAAIPLLTELALAEDKEGGPTSAVAAIAKSGTRDAVEALGTVARKAPSPEARQRALTYLAPYAGYYDAYHQFRENRDYRFAEDRAELQRWALTLIEQVAMEDPDEQAEHSAVFILGQVRSETSIPALRHAAEHGKMDDTRHTAQYALKKMGKQTE
jgi:HEAT repeat protein